MPKIPEISAGRQMERTASVSSDRHIRNHLWRWSTYFDRTGQAEFCRSIFDKPVRCPTSLHLCREFGKGIKNGKNHSSQLAGFNRKISFHFPQVFPLVPDKSVWRQWKHPACNKYHITALCPFFVFFFFRFFGGNLSGLVKETSGSRLEARARTLAK